MYTYYIVRSKIISIRPDSQSRAVVFWISWHTGSTGFTYVSDSWRRWENRCCFFSFQLAQFPTDQYCYKHAWLEVVAECASNVHLLFTFLVSASFCLCTGMINGAMGHVRYCSTSRQSPSNTLEILCTVFVSLGRCRINRWFWQSGSAWKTTWKMVYLVLKLLWVWRIIRGIHLQRLEKNF